jgi:ATP-dependent helicase/DNAse subunit B
MRRICILTALFCLFAAAQTARDLGGVSRNEEPPLKQSQVSQMLRDDHKKSLEDASRLMELAAELKIEIEKKDPGVLSLSAVKKAEEIERIARRIKSRMKRY